MPILKILTLKRHCVIFKDSFEERISPIWFINSTALISDCTSVEISWWKFELLTTINLSPLSLFP